MSLRAWRGTGTDGSLTDELLTVPLFGDDSFQIPDIEQMMQLKLPHYPTP
jgi:hypothetical protein